MPAYRKKLIEVALPLDAINKEAAREKSIRHGHPSTLHLWWARRPLAAARAVLFASLVDDPGNDLPEAEAKKERDRLFRLIEQLVKWENVNNPKVLAEAHAEIMRSTNGNPPPVLDPFAGGGTIPLAAQQLGLQAYASDLNPVAVLINKALIEIPPKFAGRKPVHPEATADDGAKKHLATHQEAAVKSALAEDVRWYGKWMRDEAFKRIGYLYPKGPNGETVIAWLWARTVKCPNPACGAQMPLITSFWLSTKKGKECWVEPIVDRTYKPPTIRFEIKTPEAGKSATPPVSPKLGRGATFRCLVCTEIADDKNVRVEFKAKRNKVQLIAMVAESKDGRIYLVPDEDHIKVANDVVPTLRPEQEMNQDSSDLVSGRGYGITHWHELFTNRQLVALTTFSNLVNEAKSLVLKHSENDVEYANAVATYLGFGVDKSVDRNTAFCSWEPEMNRMRGTFARQALAMIWDFTETNPLAGAGGDLQGTIESLCEVLDKLVVGPVGKVAQLDAASALVDVSSLLISTDPPYYDNVAYAELSDFFYIWMRLALKEIYPDIFSTLLTPKTPELVAAAYRFNGSKDKAREFFEDGLNKAFYNMRKVQNEAYPLTVYYSYKQEETEASTGWETMLEGLIKAGFAITGTWPVRTELATRSVGQGTNALASSIVLVCRPRPVNAPMATRRDFQRALDKELPAALKLLTDEQVAPVDLAQATIGPGMAVFSRYSKVIEADGEPMKVRTALQLINRAIESFFAEMESDLDSETRFCLAWYKQQGSTEGLYGEADVLAKAKNISIPMLQRVGILRAGQGKVKLLSAGDYPDDWNLDGANRITIWEATHRLVHAMQTGGDKEAGELAARLGGVAEQGRALAYQLYDVANRKGWSADALGYNDLVAAWGGVQKYAGDIPVQTTLF